MTEAILNYICSSLEESFELYNMNIDFIKVGKNLFYGIKYLLWDPETFIPPQDKNKACLEIYSKIYEHVHRYDDDPLKPYLRKETFEKLCKLYDNWALYTLRMPIYFRLMDFFLTASPEQICLFFTIIERIGFFIILGGKSIDEF